MKEKWEYVGNGGQGVNPDCLAEYGRTIMKTERHRLHKAWIADGSKPHADAPPIVHGEQWARLRANFISRAGQEKSAQMVAARSLVKNPTLTGRGGHAPIAAKLVEFPFPI